MTLNEFEGRYDGKENTCKYKINDNVDTFSGKSNISVICDSHGITSRTVHELLLAKYSCILCGKEARAASNRLNNSIKVISYKDRISEFRNMHGELYEYPTSPIGNSHSKIDVICKIHGTFSIHIHSHKKGVGCPSCRKDSKSIIDVIKKEKRDTLLAEGKQNRIIANKKRSIPTEILEERFKNKFGDKFKYTWQDYDKSKKAEISCPVHGTFVQSIKEHLNSPTGCIYCSKICITGAELNWLSVLGIKSSQHKIILSDKKFVKTDGYDDTTNTVYEFLGDYWHGHPSVWHKHNGINRNNKISFAALFKQTTDRLVKIKELGYNVCYVWEYDIKHNITQLRYFNTELEYKYEANLQNR